MTKGRRPRRPKDPGRDKDARDEDVAWETQEQGQPIPPSRQPPTAVGAATPPLPTPDRKSTRLNSSHSQISYAVFCLKKKKKDYLTTEKSLKQSLQELVAHVSRQIPFTTHL